MSSAWNCPTCTFANPEGFLACSMCGTQRPVITPVAPSTGTVVSTNPRPNPDPGAAANTNEFEGWLCSTCTFKNRATYSRCVMCRTPRPETAKNPDETTEPKPEAKDGKEVKSSTAQSRQETKTPARVVTEELKLSHGQGRERGIKWKRNARVVGTLQPRCFQKSIAYPLQDPIQVPRFSHLGFCCVPMLGIYDEDYTFAQPIMLLDMPSDNLHLIPCDRKLRSFLLGSQNSEHEHKGEQEHSERPDSGHHADHDQSIRHGPPSGVDPVDYAANPHLYDSRDFVDPDAAPDPSPDSDPNSDPDDDDDGMTAAERAERAERGDEKNSQYLQEEEMEYEDEYYMSRNSDSDTEMMPRHLRPRRRPRERKESKAEWHRRREELQNWHRERIDRAMNMRERYMEFDRENKHHEGWGYRFKELKWTDANQARQQRRRNQAAEGKRPLEEKKYPESKEHKADPDSEQRMANPIRPANSHTSTDFFVIIHERADVKKCGVLFGNDATTDPHVEGKGDAQTNTRGWRYNVVPHLWAFPNCVFSMEANENADVEVGVFDAKGLLFPHSDDSDSDVRDSEGGDTLAKNKLKRMSVNIHDRHFSPNNCVVTVDPTAEYASFFLLCEHRDRRVISFHVLPISMDFFRRVEGITSTATHLETVLASMEESSAVAVARAGRSLSAILKPLLGF